MDIMSTQGLQEGLSDGIVARMAKQTSKAIRRLRILVEMPEGGRVIWNAAKSASIRNEERLGDFIFRAIHAQVAREAPEMLPAELLEKGKKK